MKTIEDFYREDDFTSTDAKELAVVLSNKSVRRALKSILNYGQDLDTLSVYDLNGQEGLSKARMAQGTVRGIKLAVEQLIILAQPEEEEDDTV